MDDDIAGIILQYNDTYQETLCLIIAWRMQILRQTRIESSSLKFVSEVVHLTFEHQKVSIRFIREESET